MATINPYLNFMGNTEDAFNFYKSVFGGEFITLMRFKDMPGHENLPDNERDKVMHVALPIKGNVLMATDMLESMGQKLVAGNNYSVAIQADTEEEASKLFNGLSAGGTVTMPLDKAPWGALFGMFNDKFGIQWMINYDYPRN